MHNLMAIKDIITLIIFVCQRRCNFYFLRIDKENTFFYNRKPINKIHSKIIYNKNI